MSHITTWYRILGTKQFPGILLASEGMSPMEGEYAMPLSAVTYDIPLQPFFASLVSEFREPHMSWQEVVESSSGRKPLLRLEIYVWPLVRASIYHSNVLLVRRSLLVKGAEIV